MLTLKKSKTVDKRFVLLPALFFTGYLGSLAVLTRFAPPRQADSTVATVAAPSPSDTSGTSKGTKSAAPNRPSGAVTEQPSANPQSPAVSGTAGSDGQSTAPALPSPSSSATSPATAPAAGSSTVSVGSADTGNQTPGRGAGSGQMDNAASSTGIVSIPILSPITNL